MSTSPISFSDTLSANRRACGSRLLDRACAGDPDAFAHLISPYASGIGRRALRLTGNPADAEDVSQEAMLKVWRRLEQFNGVQPEPGDDFRAWVTRIASNSAIDLLRQRRDGRLLSLDEPKGGGEETLGSGFAANGENPEQRFERREKCRMLARAIRRLPRDLRRACLLRDVLHYSTQDVADRLGISLVAVRLRLFRAHRELRRNLQNPLASKAKAVAASKHFDARSRTGSAECREGRRDANLRNFRIEYACGD